MPGSAPQQILPHKPPHRKPRLPKRRLIPWYQRTRNKVHFPCQKTSLPSPTSFLSTRPPSYATPVKLSTLLACPESKKTLSRIQIDSVPIGARAQSSPGLARPLVHNNSSSRLKARATLQDLSTCTHEAQSCNLSRWPIAPDNRYPRCERSQLQMLRLLASKQLPATTRQATQRPPGQCPHK